MATAAIAVVCAAGVRSQTREPRPLDDPEAYAVYAALLPGEWAVRRARATRLVFQRETEVSRSCVPTGVALQTDWKPVVDHFWSENAHVRLMAEGFPLGIPYVVVPSADIRALFDPSSRGDIWARFYQRYPDSGGYITVSAVGFDAEKRRAIVHMGSVYGLLGAEWRFRFLTKTDSGWTETSLPGVTGCWRMS